MDAILLGGGVGKRYLDSSRQPSLSSIESIPKQFQMLHDLPVFIHAMKAFLSLEVIREVFFTTPEAYLHLADSQVAQFLSSPEKGRIRLVVGGETRQESSRLALEAAAQNSEPPTRILIHDACRPFLSQEFLLKIREKLLDRSYAAWIPVIPVVETLKRVENSQVLETVDRDLFRRVQTPQIFEFRVIRALAEKTRELGGKNFTDDASLCEYFGIPVGTFGGDVRNIKLTYEFEMQTLCAVIEPQNSREPKEI